MKIGILNSIDNSYKNYIYACDDLGVDYEVFDFSDNRIMDKVKDREDINAYLVRPPGMIKEIHDIYMLRLYIMNKQMGKFIYPSYEELFIYENKLAFSEWLKIKNYPHLEFEVFTDYETAAHFIHSQNFPIIAKGAVGSSASTVTKLDTEKDANKYLKRIFSPYHPNFKPIYEDKGRLPRVKKVYYQKNYAILQNFIDIKWEWRIIRIGESYFGYRKLLDGEFASGSKEKGWGPVPAELFKLIDLICDENNFYSMSMDVLESLDGEYYINELQSLFGVSRKNKNAQCMVNDVPGRYVKRNDSYHFEEGDFIQHSCYLLRVKHFLKLVQSLNNKSYVDGYA